MYMKGTVRDQKHTMFLNVWS